MATSSSSTPAQERDNTLLSIGKQCSDPSCRLVDFLPFKCQHCEQSFCQEHFKVDAHHCSKYEEFKHNRIAPYCPLCNTPVPLAPGQDPNVGMSLHLEKECSVATGKVKKASTTPVCARNSCKTLLITPVRCSACRRDFCVPHRFPGDHNCTPISAATSANKGSKGTTRPSMPTRPSMAAITAGAQNLNTKATTAGNAALGAVKTSVAAASALAKTQTVQALPASIPFRAMDRRAKAERESRMRALQARAKKGLLNENERAFLAAEEAAAKEDKDNCIIM